MTLFSCAFYTFWLPGVEIISILLAPTWITHMRSSFRSWRYVCNSKFSEPPDKLEQEIGIFAQIRKRESPLSNSHLQSWLEPNCFERWRVVLEQAMDICMLLGNLSVLWYVCYGIFSCVWISWKILSTLPTYQELRQSVDSKPSLSWLNAQCNSIMFVIEFTWRCWEFMCLP